MAIKSSLSTQKFSSVHSLSNLFLSTTLLATLLVAAGCQTKPKRPDARADSHKQGMGPILTEKEEYPAYGSETREAKDSKDAILEENKSQPTSPTVWQKSGQRKVAVVLGPGGAKAFAHVGVLKTLAQNRIPIDKVVGLEWGALVGGVYASKGQVHEVEWKLYKMEQKDWLPKKGIFNSQSSGAAVNSMNDFFKDAFGNTQLSDFRVPFGCASRSLWTATLVMQNKGAAKDVMKKCVPFPPLFQVKGSFIAAPSNTMDVVRGLKAEGFEIVILVDVLGSAQPVGQDALMEYASQVILWQEVRRELRWARSIATDVIEVDTSAYPMSKFEARKDLVELGESSSRSLVNAIVNKYDF